ncbi:MAG TPA: hypothetical protein DCE41_00410 [Cytophagales bacterium]|nr:hypothetical protein [Cytophagales bacterium]HAA19073.1 hypothetical protein [Cytophagales bacterium]HAP64098.1 hypothetical protein [Cytophagales bacterium]
MRIKRIILFALLGMTGGAALGQNVFEKYLSDPEMVFKFREEIDLTDRQADRITSEYEANLVAFQAMKMELEEKINAMAELLEDTTPHREEAMGLMQEMMALETKIKTLRLETLLVVQEVLTPEQRDYLRNHKPDGAMDWEPTYRIDPLPDVNIVVRNRLADSKNPLLLLRVKKEYYQLSRQQMKSLIPDEIEQIEVLKDRSAISLFGNKAKDGVVVLVLKSSRIPRGAKKFELP